MCNLVVQVDCLIGQGWTGDDGTLARVVQNNLEDMRVIACTWTARAHDDAIDDELIHSGNDCHITGFYFICCCLI